jgi:hypothetical protein
MVGKQFLRLFFSFCGENFDGERIDRGGGGSCAGLRAWGDCVAAELIERFKSFRVRLLDSYSSLSNRETCSSFNAKFVWSSEMFVWGGGGEREAYSTFGAPAYEMRGG